MLGFIKIVAIFATLFICQQNHLASGQLSLKKLKTVAEWKELEFQFPLPEDKNLALLSGKYVPGNAVPIDVQVDYKDRGQTRLFVTIPRFQTGIPITFGSLTSIPGNGGPIIQPYPDYTWHSSHGANCDGITSVFRIAVDECKRLWILDSGRIGDTQFCPPQLLAFNLNNDKLLHRYAFPKDQLRDVSLLITPMVNVKDPPPGKCQNTVVYVTDVTGFALLVFDLKAKKSWRVTNKLLFPHPTYGTYVIAGETFDLMDGPLGLSLSPQGSSLAKIFGTYFPGNTVVPAPQNTDRLLYFHSLAAGTENVVSTKLLDNSTIWEADNGALPRAFVEIGSRGTQSAAEAMDSNGNLFFGLMNPISVACWHSATPYNKNNIRIVSQDDKNLQFTSGLKVIKNRKGQEELWVLSCRFQKIMTGTINSNEVNFRILALSIDDLLNGKKCGKNIGEPTTNFVFPKY